MIGITDTEEIFDEAGLVRRSGTRFLFPLKLYLENHIFKRSSWLFGRDLNMKLKIFGKAELSNRTRK